MKAFIFIALLALIAVMVVTVSKSDERTGDTGGTGLSAYRHPQYGFSFEYPDRATLYDSTNDDGLASPVEVPQLVRIVLPETYHNLKSEGASWNYLLEVSLGGTDETVSTPELAAATRDYRAEISDGEYVFLITLDGIWPGGPEVPPSVREAFTTVRESFEVAEKAQRP